MLQPFPSANDFATDNEAESALQWIREFILGVRRIRAENNIEPNRRLSVQVKDGTPQERIWLESHGVYIRQLARTESIERMLEGEQDAASTIAGETTVLVPLAGLIDPAVEIQRLEKELSSKRNELDRASAKLANAAFVEKAPPPVVDKVRAQITDLEDKIPRIDTQLQKLRS
jgi:valyl-tRNA synthetase